LDFAGSPPKKGQTEKRSDEKGGTLAGELVTELDVVVSRKLGRWEKKGGGDSVAAISGVPGTLARRGKQSINRQAQPRGFARSLEKKNG
jgi:hypothetical protein